MKIMNLIKKLTMTNNNNTGDRNSGNSNSGHWNSGNSNSGNSNSGHCNSGDRNSGDRNSGDRNSGHCNSGDRNSGHCNSGDWNSGDWNSGNRNSGHCNSGNRNSGNRNSGHWNSGNSNSGNRNSGHCNSGDWNSGNSNSGSFNTTEPKMRLFNKELDMTVSEFYQKYSLYANIPLNRWVDKEDMTDEEKSSVSGWQTMGGYLKTLDFKEACRIWWDENPDDHERFLSLPGFDADIFEEITGIDVKQSNRTIEDVLAELSDKDKELVKKALR